MQQDLTHVPTLSLRDFTEGSLASRARFTQKLWEGFQYFGFIILRDHAIAPALLKQAYDLSERFFDQSLEQKKKSMGVANRNRGYVVFGQEHAKTSTVGDLKEFFHIGREHPAHTTPKEKVSLNVWPQYPEPFREVFLSLYAALEEAGHVLLQALESPLKLPPGYFQTLVAEGNSILRLLHYPPVPADADPRAIRAAAHEDINLITILVAANGAGLELLDRKNCWVPVETDAENLIVDAGDMLARITNDVIPATTHRVVNPSGPNVSRYSMPFFMHPRSDAILECIESCKGTGAKYPPIMAEMFLQERLKEIGLGEE